MILKQKYPDADLHYLRDVANIAPVSEAYSMLLSVPEFATREELLALLDKDYARLKIRHDGDRLPGQNISDSLLHKLIAENALIY